MRISSYDIDYPNELRIWQVYGQLVASVTLIYVCRPL